MDIKQELLKILERRVFNAEELVEEIDKLYKQDKALQLQQTGVNGCFNISEDELIKGFQNSISLLKQTTEFEVLDSFKIKVDELEKLLEETKM